MSDIVECYFDISSPWTYLAFHNLQPIAREVGFEVRWRPILVGGIFNSINHSVYASRERPVPQKQAYLQKDLRDWANASGLKIRFPPTIFPVNSVKAMRGCIWLEEQGRLVDFARAAFEAYWGEDRDISQDTELAVVCGRIGVEPKAFFEGIATTPVKEELRRNTDDVVKRGGFGSPTMFVGDDMYFGNDRLHFVRDAVLRRRR